MSNLDDLVALLLQGQAPFAEEDFRQACANYRQNSSARGAMLRSQVNLAGCLYLDVNKERPTEPRVRTLGGWGSRNDVLADIAGFHSGRRPTSTVSMTSALPSVLPAVGMKASDALQIAMQQGLDAAQRMIENSVRLEFETRIGAAQEDFTRRLHAFEELAGEAHRRQEAAEAQRLVMERKFDEAHTKLADTQAMQASLVASSSALEVQNSALVQTIARERQALDAVNTSALDLRQQVLDLTTAVDQERKQALLHLDSGRQSEIKSEQLRLRLEKLTEQKSQLEIDLVQIRRDSDAAKRHAEEAKSWTSSFNVLKSFIEERSSVSTEQWTSAVSTTVEMKDLIKTVHADVSTSIESVAQALRNHDDTFSILKNCRVATSDPDIFNGEPVFTGTRVPVSTLFANILDGMTLEQFSDSYPSVNKETLFLAIQQSQEITKLLASDATGS